MKRLLGKALGILLSVSMMVSLVPGMAVFAATDETGGTEVEIEDDEIDPKAQEVIDMINSFPDLEDVTLDDYELIVVAAGKYDDLIKYDLQGQVENAFPEIEDMEEYLDEYAIYVWELVFDAYDEFYDSLEKIPDIDELTLDDENTVKAARDAFNKIPANLQKDFLDTDSYFYTEYYSILVSAEEKIADLKAEAEAAKAAEEKAAADKAKVDAVIKMIEDLPDPDKVTLDDYDAVYEAVEAYEDLEELGEGIDEALVEKLYADRIKVELLDLEDLISVSETLLSNYEDLLSADMITEIQDKIDAAKEVLNAEDPAIEDIWNAFDDLLFALYEANDIIWVHYTIVEGENAVYITNSDTGIKFRIRQEGIHDWAYDLFLDAGSVLLIDGEELPEGAAKTSQGSLIIEIMPDFLKTLSVGEHKLTVKFDNDVTMDLVFTVRAATDVPASGESVSAAVYVGIAMVVLAAAGFVVNKRMAKKES